MHEQGSRFHTLIELVNGQYKSFDLRRGKRACSSCRALTLVIVLFLTASGELAQQVPPSSDGVSIRGSVLDSRGNPVAAATVKLECERGSAQVATNAAGGYEFSALLVGSYSLEATKSGLHSAVATVDAAAKGGEEKVNLTLAEKESTRSGADESLKPPPQRMEYSDAPSFTIAGVTDWTAVGGHGSDSSLRTSEALARETLALKPEETEHSAASDANQRSAALHRQAGERAEKRGDPLSAVREFEQAVRLGPSEENYFEWGSELLLHRAIWQAQEVFEKGVQLYPRSARMLTGLGSSLFAGARYDEAAQRLCKASDLNQKDPEPYMFMGKIQVSAPDPLECIEKRLARFAEEQPGSSWPIICMRWPY